MKAYRLYIHKNGPLNQVLEGALMSNKRSNIRLYILKMQNYDFKTRVGRQRFYQSENWIKARAYKLMQNPLCEDCLKKEVLTPATEVDHKVDLVDAPYLCLVLENLRALCKSCHSKKTISKMNGKESLGKILNNSWNIDVLKFKR